MEDHIRKSFRGLFQPGSVFYVIAVPRTNSTYNYITNNVAKINNPIWGFSQRKIQTEWEIVMSSDLTNILKNEKNYLQNKPSLFKPDSYNNFQSITPEGEVNESIILKTNSGNTVDNRPFSGLGYNTTSNILVQTEIDSYPGANLNQSRRIYNFPATSTYQNSDLESYSIQGNNINFSLTTTTTYIDLSGFGLTSSQILDISFSGEMTISDGTNTEYIIYEYFNEDLVCLSGCKRGCFGSTAQSFVSDNVTIQFRIYNHPNNYVNSSSLSGFIDSLEFYLIPREENCFMHKFVNLDHNNIKTYLSSDSLKLYTPNGISTTQYPDFMVLMNIIFEILPTHSSFQDTLKIFPNRVEAIQGYNYNYCRGDQKCGACMGRTSSNDRICSVRNDTYENINNGKLGLFEEPLVPADENRPSDWNNRNKNWNYYFPIIITSVYVLIFIISAIIYGISLRDANEVFLDLQRQDRAMDMKKTAPPPRTG